IDNKEAGSKAALYFIKKNIRNIGSVLPNKRYLAMDLRYEGFLDTCDKHNIKIRDENIITVDDNTIQSGMEAAEKFVNLSNPPKGIYCGSDYIAHGLLYSLNRKGIKIPDDVQIITVGYNNIEYSLYNDSSMFYLDIPIEKMAIRSLRLVYDILQGKETEPHNIILNTELIQQK